MRYQMQFVAGLVAFLLAPPHVFGQSLEPTDLLRRSVDNRIWHDSCRWTAASTTTAGALDGTSHTYNSECDVVIDIDSGSIKITQKEQLNTFQTKSVDRVLTQICNQDLAMRINRGPDPRLKDPESDVVALGAEFRTDLAQALSEIQVSVRAGFQLDGMLPGATVDIIAALLESKSKLSVVESQDAGGRSIVEISAQLPDGSTKAVQLWHDKGDLLVGASSTMWTYPRMVGAGLGYAASSNSAGERYPSAECRRTRL